MIKTDKYTLELLELSIIKITISENKEIELADVLEMRDSCSQLSNSGRFCILLDATKNFMVSSSAREKLASKEFSSERVASAFYTRSLANVLVGNFFIKFNKPSDPTKLFRDETSALLWLKKEIEKKGS